MKNSGWPVGEGHFLHLPDQFHLNWLRGGRLPEHISLFLFAKELEISYARQPFEAVPPAEYCKSGCTQNGKSGTLKTKTEISSFGIALILNKDTIRFGADQERKADFLLVLATFSTYRIKYICIKLQLLAPEM